LPAVKSCRQLRSFSCPLQFAPSASLRRGVSRKRRSFYLFLDLATRGVHTQRKLSGHRKYFYRQGGVIQKPSDETLVKRSKSARWILHFVCERSRHAFRGWVGLTVSRGDLKRCVSHSFVRHQSSGTTAEEAGPDERQESPASRFNVASNFCSSNFDPKIRNVRSFTNGEVERLACKDVQGRREALYFCMSRTQLLDCSRGAPPANVLPHVASLASIDMQGKC